METGSYPSVCFYCGWQYTASRINQRCPKCHWEDSQHNRLQGARLIGVDPTTGQPNEFFQKVAAEPSRPIAQEARTSSTARKRRRRGPPCGPQLVNSKEDFKQHVDDALNALKNSPGSVNITVLAKKIGWARGTLYNYAREYQVDLWAYIDNFLET
jgi:hypothetical protein